jgi:predicted phage terminase large subunit-like protein
MGSLAFQAQYQQAPIPAEGNLVKAHWFKRFATPPARRGGDTVIQSWDCATKTGTRNDWSVCVTALSRGGQIYVLDVYRARLEFPALHKQVIALAREHQADALLIEDAGSGQPLIQTLRQASPTGVPRPIAIKPFADKQVRMDRPSVAMESGAILLPEDAPWLGEFMTELLGFPGARHDDQVDALAQLVTWVLSRRSASIPAGAIEVPCDGSFPMRSYGAVGEDDEDPMDGLYGLCVSEPRWP